MKSASLVVLVLVATTCNAQPLLNRIDPPAARSSMAPNLTNAEDSVIASWLEPADPARTGPGSEYHLRCARFRDGAWGDPMTVVTGKDFFVNWADVPLVIDAGEGVMIAHWLQRSGPATYAYDVALARSEDGGGAWERRGTLHNDETKTEHGFVSMVREDKGVRAFWLDGRETGGGHGHGHDDGHGAKGSMTLRTALIGSEIRQSAVLDARVCDCCSTSGAMTSEGPLIVYRDRAADEVRDISIVRWREGRWSLPKPVHSDRWLMPACPVNGPEVDARGRDVAVAWYTAADERPLVRVAFSRDAGARFEPPLEVARVTETSAPLGRVDVLYDGRDQVLVTWLRAEGTSGKIMARQVRRTGLMSAPFVIAPTTPDRSSGFPRLAGTPDGILVIWTDTRDQTIRAGVLGD